MNPKTSEGRAGKALGIMESHQELESPRTSLEVLIESYENACTIEEELVHAS